MPQATTQGDNIQCRYLLLLNGGYLTAEILRSPAEDEQFTNGGVWVGYDPEPGDLRLQRPLLVLLGAPDQR